MPKYYAVRNGRSPGVYDSWDDCKAQTNGYSGSQYKSFGSAEEANQYVSGSTHTSSAGHSSAYDYEDNDCDFEPMMSSSRSSGSGGRLRIYTDGACANNGRGGAEGGVGVHFPDKPHLDISEPLYGRQTNNRAEIEAARRAIEVAKQEGHRKVEINTDSEFLHKAVNEWSQKWKQNDWKKSDGKDVINKQDFQQLEDVSKGMDIQWVKVPAHQGVDGNERADRLANEGITKGRNYR